MASRNITTVFTVKGENEYKKKISDINRSLKTMRSEMKLTDKAFEGNDESLEALGQKYDILKRTYETQQKKVEEIESALKYSEDALAGFVSRGEDLTSQLAALSDKINSIKDSGEDSLGEMEELLKQKETLERNLKGNTESEEKFRMFSDNWQTQLNNAKSDLLDTKRALDDTSDSLDEARKKADEFGDGAEGAGEDAEKMAEKTNTSLETIATMAATLGLEKIFSGISDAIKSCLDASTEFETAFTGVYKTVDGTTEQFEDIKAGIKDLAREIPVSTTEIAGVAESAGQLGISAENILDFTEVMIKLGTATNLSSVEGASALAKFANITKMSSDDYGRLGSTIVDLGNNFATTERDIVEMATRLASTGAVLGLSEAQILAIATALSSVGIEAEAGGSAFSKLLKNVAVGVAGYPKIPNILEESGLTIEELKKLALEGGADFKAVANPLGYSTKQLQDIVDGYTMLENMGELTGRTADQFVNAWKAAPLEALNDFINALGQVDENDGGAIQILEDLGIKEVRMSNATLSLASSNNILTRALNAAEEAWDSNTALNEEASRAYSTTASKEQLLKNNTEQLKQAIGDDFITTLSPALDVLTSLAGSVTDAAEDSPALSSSLAGIGSGLGTIAGAASAAGVIKAIASGIKLIGDGAASAVTGTGIFAGLIAAAYTYHENVTKLPEDTQNLISSSERIIDSISYARDAYQDAGNDAEIMRDKVGKLTDKLFELSDKMQKTPADEAIIKDCVDRLNSYLPGLGLTWDSVTGSINLSRDAIYEFAEAAGEMDKLERIRDYMSELSGKKLDLEINSGLLENELKDAEDALRKAQDALKGANSRGMLYNLMANFNPNVKSVNDYSNEVDAAMRRVSELRDQLKENKITEEEAERELESIKQLYNTETVEYYTSKLADLNSELSDLRSDYGELAEVEGLSINSWQMTDKDFESAISGISDETKKKLLELRDELKNLAAVLNDTKAEAERAYKSGAEVGSSYGQGLVDGAERSTKQLKQVSHNLHSVLEEEGKETLDIHSPSRKARELGENWGEGLILGLKDRYAAVKTASDELSGGILAGMARNALSGISKASAVSGERVSLPSVSSSGERENVFRADVPIILQLDGNVLSRTVSRIQWRDDRLSSRARGG